MTAAALGSLRTAAAAQRETLRPGTVVIKLADQTSDELDAAVVVKATLWKEDDHGQMRTVEPVTVHVLNVHLPEWATLESLPTKAKVTIGTKVYKVASTFAHGPALIINGYRWPSDDDT